jgi:hypothetical protein
MAIPQTIKIDPKQLVSIEVAGASPHLFRYKLWLKPADAPAWQFLGKGTASAATPNRIDVSQQIASGTLLQYWLGIAGNPNMPCRATFQVEQGGQIINNGRWDEEDPMTGKSFTEVARILKFVN